jgi:outer membrane protein
MRKTSCLLAGMVLATAGLAEAVHAETLEEVLSSTYNTNPTLLARRAALRAADEGVPQALSNWRPTVTLAGSIGRGVYSSNLGLPFVMGRTPKTESLSVVQPLFRGFRTVAATRQAENTVLAGRAQLASTEQSVLLNAATAFLNVVRDEAVVKLNISNEQVLRRQLEAAQERFKVGEITRTDVSQAEARLAGAVADRVAAEGALQSSRANYLNNVGRPPESPQMLTQAVAVPASLDEVTAITLAQNPNVVASDYAFKAATDGIDLVAGELLPTVTLNGNLSRGLQTGTQDSQVITREAVINLVVPLYEGGAVYSRLRAQKHTTGQRRIESDQARRDATETATRAWESLQAARAQVSSFLSQIKASELALAGVEEEAKVGSRTVLDVLNAEQELFNARVNLARAEHDQYVAAFQVKSAVGQMTAQGLSLPVDTYDPTKHYDDVRLKFIGWGINKENGYE